MEIDGNPFRLVLTRADMNAEDIVEGIKMGG
jgi:hypothetical protein